MHKPRAGFSIMLGHADLYAFLYLFHAEASLQTASNYNVRILADSENHWPTSTPNSSTAAGKLDVLDSWRK